MKRKYSLKWQLVALITVCWILPILIVIGFSGGYMHDNVKLRIEDTVTAEVQNAAITTAERLEQVVLSSRKASYFSNIKSAHQQYLANGDEMMLYEQVNTFLTSQYKYDQQLKTTFLYFTNDQDTVYYACNLANNSTFANVRQYRSNLHTRVLSSSKTLGSGVQFLFDGDSVYMVRNILSSDFEPYAVITMELNTNAVFEAMRSIVWQTGASIWVSDTKLTLIGASRAYPNNAQGIAQNCVYDELLGNIAYGCTTSDSFLLSYVVSVDTTAIVSSLPDIWKIIRAMLLLIIPLLAAVIWFFYRQISSPLNHLNKAAVHIEDGDIGFQVETNWGTEEFCTLSLQFNSMSNRFVKYVQSIYQEQQALQDARIKALQSQINPHFLNNTLEIINWQARMADDAPVYEMIESLSTMLCAAMARDGNPFVKLEEELTYVNAYLHIQKVRLGERLEVAMEVDKALLGNKVPRLMLQPLVENAIEHGISTLQSGVITIRAFLKGTEQMIIEIENDGELSVEDQAAIYQLLASSQHGGQKRERLGVSNVNMRIKMLYAGMGSLIIKSTNAKTTVARVIIPVNPQYRL